jgi:hypothetical protein
MKKLLVASMLVALVMALGTGTAFALNKNNTGCGLGYIIFKENPDTVLFQIFAATTNGTSSNQTFGMSTGTLECQQPTVVASIELQEFVAANMDTLAQDMATGEGETLATLAELMEVPSADRDRFYATLQDNFASIYTHGDIQSAEVIDNIVQVTEAS